MTYDEQLAFRDKVALEILKSILINKTPFGDSALIEVQCRTAYKYADTLYKVRMDTLYNKTNQEGNK